MRGTGSLCGTLGTYNVFIVWVESQRGILVLFECFCCLMPPFVLTQRHGNATKIDENSLARMRLTVSDNHSLLTWLPMEVQLVHNRTGRALHCTMYNVKLTLLVSFMT